MSVGFLAPVPVRWSDITTTGLLIAEMQLAAVHIDEQRLVRLAPHHRDYLQRWLR